MEKLTTENKALKLNLQPSIYGVFAEIGAGQEVANHFYNAGAASGTIAKTISAYDMTISDSTYGTTKKYVSKDRLNSMLNVEYENLIGGLNNRAAVSQFFVLASTIEVINYHKNNKGHGWIGIKFQHTPNGSPSVIRLHFNMHTDDIRKQRELIGILGVNLIYGAFEYLQDPSLFITSLADNIDLDDLEINAIEHNGLSTLNTLNMELTLLLVKKGLTKMVMIGSNKEILQPQNALYKKNVILTRGRFRPPTNVSLEMFTKSKNQLIKNGIQKHEILPVAEITFQCYQEHTELMLNDLLKRIELLSALGIPVMITNFTYHHDFIKFINDHYNVASLNIVLGMDNLRKVFGVHNLNFKHAHLLELLQTLSTENASILVFPELDNKQNIRALETMKLNGETKLLLDYLVATKRIQNLEDVNPEVLRIRSDEVMKAIQENNGLWETQVPKSIIPLLGSSQARRANNGAWLAT